MQSLPTMLGFALLLTATHALVLDAKAGSSPVEQVVALMERLKANVEEEGKAEAAGYDKFACFCKEQADGKLYAIEKSKALEAKLSAQIKELTAEIIELESDISALSKKIEDLSAQLKQLEEERAKTHETYEKEEADVSDAIAACKKAIEVLKGSKEKIKEGGGKVDLAQVLAEVVRPGAGERGRAVAALLRQTEDPKAFEYQSNGIIETIRDLMLQFKGDKDELDSAEAASKMAFDKKHLGLSKQKKFAEKDKSEKEQLKEEKTEEKQKAQSDYDSEVEARKADEGFLDELTVTCEKKAKAWDERSKTRSAELTALTEATEALKTGAQKNYESNKLAALQRNQRRAAALNFLQVGAASQGREVIRRVQAELRDAAFRTHSSALARVAAAIGSQGMFDKVKGLIEDLIKKMEDEAKEEAKMQDFCSDKMKDALDKKEGTAAEVEEAEATIVQDTVEMKEAMADVQKLSEEIAAGKKALLEATELRASEKKTNAKTLADAMAGKGAVSMAINILKNFYGFLQMHSRGGPDREGNTVSDLAPETFEGDYEKKGDESGGIMAILGMILDDFEKTTSETEESESDAEADMEKFDKDSSDDDKAMNKQKDEKEKTIADLKSEIAELKETVLGGAMSLKNSAEELKKLQAMCVFGAENAEEKVKQREEEIKALKGALKLLDEFEKK